MANQINSNTDIFKQSQDDIFGDGKDDLTAPNAGGNVSVSLADGQKSTTVAVDGDLEGIDTESEALGLDPTANNSGASSVGYTRNFLLRWLVKLAQGISGRLRVSAYDVISLQTDATGTAYVAVSSGVATHLTFINNTGTDLSLAKGGTGVAIPLADQTEVSLPVLNNSNEWSVKRTDESTTQVTVPILRYTL